MVNKEKGVNIIMTC